MFAPRRARLAQWDFSLVFSCILSIRFAGLYLGFRIWVARVQSFGGKARARISDGQHELHSRPECARPRACQWRQHTPVQLLSARSRVRAAVLCSPCSTPQSTAPWALNANGVSLFSKAIRGRSARRLAPGFSISTRWLLRRFAAARGFGGTRQSMFPRVPTASRLMP